MRARFIYEKFTQESDPVRDLGIGSYRLLPRLILENDNLRMFFTAQISKTQLNMWIYHHSVTSPYGYYRRNAPKTKEHINEKIVKQYVEELFKKIGFEHLIYYMEIEMNPRSNVSSDHTISHITFFYDFRSSVPHTIKCKRLYSNAGNDYIDEREKNIEEI